MEAFKKVMNVFGIIAAGILSIFLVVSLVAVPVISAATSFFEARNIKKVLSGIDYSQMIMGEMSSGESAELTIAGNELMQQLMDTEMMEDIIQLCVDNVFAVMDGESGVEKFTAVDIQMIGEEHLDELAEILKQYVKIDINVNLSYEFYRNTARNIMAEYAVQIAQIGDLHIYFPKTHTASSAPINLIEGNKAVKTSKPKASTYIGTVVLRFAQEVKTLA